ncbi:response regulator [Bradyrhizobium sp. A11]|uniref:response regulator n=1 Tax=Bradyrhizobium sp. A11 TaxID=3133974 RepID=UPI0032522071
MPDKPVLVVDDDPALLRGLERLLRKHGYETVAFSKASDLRSYTEVARARCIVLDIDLGRDSGIELGIQLRNAGHSIPIIYITGNDSQATRHAAMECGFLAYLVKPFDARSLIHSIEQSSQVR